MTIFALPGVNVQFSHLGPQWSATPVPSFKQSYFNGPYAILGGRTVDSGGTPHAREVYLLGYPSLVVLGKQMSDPTTGAFAWYNLKIPVAPKRLVMLATDPAGLVNAGVHDAVVPS